MRKSLAADLIQLRDRLAELPRSFPELEISFGQQIQILRLVRMFADLFDQLRQIQLRSRRRVGEVGAVVQIVEKVLIRIRAGGSVFRKSLKHIQISLGGLRLMQAALHHGELVISRCGIRAHLDVFSKQLGGFLELFLLDAQIGEFQQRFGEVRL